jgi:hypothetical protein
MTAARMDACGFPTIEVAATPRHAAARQGRELAFTIRWKPAPRHPRIAVADRVRLLGYRQAGGAMSLVGAVEQRRQQRSKLVPGPNPIELFADRVVQRQRNGGHHDGDRKDDHARNVHAAYLGRRTPGPDTRFVLAGLLVAAMCGYRKAPGLRRSRCGQPPVRRGETRTQDGGAPHCGAAGRSRDYSHVKHKPGATDDQHERHRHSAS